MAKLKDNFTIQIRLEPSEETLLISKRMLEMWVNAADGRDFLIREQYTEDGKRIYLDLVDERKDSL